MAESRSRKCLLAGGHKLPEIFKTGNTQSRLEKNRESLEMVPERPVPSDVAGRADVAVE